MKVVVLLVKHLPNKTENILVENDACIGHTFSHNLSAVGKLFLCRHITHVFNTGICVNTWLETNALTKYG